MKEDDFKLAIQSFGEATQFVPYDWQELIIATVTTCHRKNKRPMMLNLPTGLGKSIVAYCVALILCNVLKTKVLLVSQNTHAKMTSFSKYADKKLSDMFPARLAGHKSILHVTFNELESVSNSKHASCDYVAVIDEFDQLVNFMVSIKGH